MEYNKTKLMEMAETDEGYSLNYITPFFLHKNVYELLEKSQTALLIYTELQKTISSGSFAKITDICRQAKSEDSGMREIMTEFDISEQTAKYLLDCPIGDVVTFETEDFSTSIEIYKEAVKAFTIIAEKQKYIDSLLTD